MAQRRPTLPPALTRGHDHHQCVHNALVEAERLCASRDVRLTELRKRVLELIWASHAPVGAYAIMDLLRGEGRNAMPPTVYRALDFLLEQRLIHRIASLNAYIGCSHPGDRHAMQYLICKTCGTVAEIDNPAIDAAIAASTGGLGFVPDSQTLEVSGVCRDCRDAAR